MTIPKKQMEQVQGAPLAASTLDGFAKARDLIFFEGALLSHFKSPEGGDYLYLWSDADDRANRWTIFPVSASGIQEYLDGKLSLYDLMFNESVPTLMLADIDADLRVRLLVSVAPELLPGDYVPDKDSFYPAADLHGG